MFTGITRGVFPIAQIDRQGDLLRYAVALPDDLGRGLEVGASVSIDGVCQTVTGIEGASVHFDAIAETLDRTTLGEIEIGQLVAVERSAKVGDEVGGHDVSGHVIGTGTIRARRAEGHACDLEIAVPPEWMKYISVKGFVAVDGSSLTVGECSSSGGFWVHLIPETLRLTRLGEKAEGDRVNIELDARTVSIVDTVERVLLEREN